MNTETVLSAIKGSNVGGPGVPSQVIVEPNSLGFNVIWKAPELSPGQPVHKSYLLKVFGERAVKQSDTTLGAELEWSINGNIMELVYKQVSTDVWEMLNTGDEQSFGGVYNCCGCQGC